MHGGSPPRRQKGHNVKDPRLDRLAEVLVTYSTRVQPGENVLIEASDTPDEMVVALIRAVRSAGGYPFVNIRHSVIGRELVMNCEEEFREATR